MILRLCRVELLKVRRSLVLLMSLACPLTVIVLVFGLNLRHTAPADMDAEKWGMLWAGVSAMWSWFMLPLYIALATSLINGNEHRHQSWRLMLSLPISRFELFAAKALVAALLMSCAHFTLLAGTSLVIGVLGLFDYPLTGAFAMQASAMLWAAPVAALPILVFQHALSWRLRTIVPPLAFAVLATFASIYLGRSDYWMYLPWSYPLMATNASMEASRQAALSLALLVTAVAFPLTAWWLGRREVV